MTKPGRNSSSDLALAKNTIVDRIERPIPSSNLSPDEADIWMDTVGDLPGTWFPVHTHELLAQYCRHCVSVEKIAALILQIENAEEFDIKEYDNLLKMRERESRAASSHATRLRLTPQSTYDKSKKKGSSVKRPWES
tara:strand:- start:11372 stop:11782 length:411 start_codon:yes stop_codon:yes gene_type:complete